LFIVRAFLCRKANAGILANKSLPGYLKKIRHIFPVYFSAIKAAKFFWCAYLAAVLKSSAFMIEF